MTNKDTLLTAIRLTAVLMLVGLLVAVIVQTRRTDRIIAEHKPCPTVQPIDYEAMITDKLAEYLVENPIMEQWPERVEYELPKATGNFKTFMDYRTITRKTSKQYALQQLCWTDASGFRRYNDDYVVALGSYFLDEIGERFEIHLSGGRVFTATAGDLKWDDHTDPSNRYIEMNGNIVEFIVDKELLPDEIINRGTISALGFTGDVIKIIKLKDN